MLSPKFPKYYNAKIFAVLQQRELDIAQKNGAEDGISEFYWRRANRAARRLA